MNNGTGHDIASEFYEDEITIADMLGVLIENRWLIASIMVVVFSAGIAYTMLATPIYKADGLLQVEERNSSLSTLDVDSIFEGDTSINAEIEILRSRLVLGEVVDTLKLDISAAPDYLPFIGSTLEKLVDESERRLIRVSLLEVPPDLVEQPLSLIAASSSDYQLLSQNGDILLNGVVGQDAEGNYDGEPVRIHVADLQADAGDEFDVMKLSRLGTIGRLKGALRITEKGNGSGILEISLEGSNPKWVSVQVNAIADSYVSQNKDQKTKEAENTLTFLNDQLPTVKQDMETAEVALNSYRLGKGSVDLPLETQAILETIVAVEGQRNELELERVNVIQAFTPAHPMVIAVDEQLSRLNAELAALNNQVRELPNTQQEVLRLVRDVAVNTELYTSLLNTAQELRVIKAGTVGNVRVVDAAVAPLRPVKPRKTLVLIAALILGAFLGVAMAFVRRALNSGVEDPELIEQRVGIPVYATISHSKRQTQLFKELQADDSKAEVLAIDSPHDPTVESIRNVRTALHFRITDVKNNCLMVTGPTPSVGKSFVSVNLAAVLTSNGMKVLLIDGDMRRGRLHQYLGMRREDGLSDYLSGDIVLDDALHPTSINGLTLIPSGRIPTDPTELLMHKRFAQCFDELSARYDHIIIDTPPVLAVTDAALIGQMCGATVMVLKSGAHPMREIELSVKRLRQVGVELRGLMINDITVGSRRYGVGKYTYTYTSDDLQDPAAP